MLSFSVPTSILTLADALFFEREGYELTLNHATRRVDAHKDEPAQAEWEQDDWEEDDDGAEDFDPYN